MVDSRPDYRPCSSAVELSLSTEYPLLILHPYLVMSSNASRTYRKRSGVSKRKAEDAGSCHKGGWRMKQRAEQPETIVAGHLSTCKAWSSTRFWLEKFERCSVPCCDRVEISRASRYCVLTQKPLRNLCILCGTGCLALRQPPTDHPYLNFIFHARGCVIYNRHRYPGLRDHSLLRGR